MFGIQFLDLDSETAFVSIDVVDAHVEEAGYRGCIKADDKVAEDGVVELFQLRHLVSDVDVFTNDIQNYVRQQYEIRIGERTAENIKCAIGAAVPELENEPEDFVFTGSNMRTNMPHEVKLNYSEIAYALDKSLVKLDNALMEVLESMPPELYSDVVKNGIYLAGGGALIKGLDQRLSKKSGLPVHIADDPLRAIARGTCIALKNIGNFSFLLGGEK